MAAIRWWQIYVLSGCPMWWACIISFMIGIPNPKLPSLLLFPKNWKVFNLILHNGSELYVWLVQMKVLGSRGGLFDSWHLVDSFLDSRKKKSLCVHSTCVDSEFKTVKRHLEISVWTLVKLKAENEKMWGKSNSKKCGWILTSLILTPITLTIAI